MNNKKKNNTRAALLVTIVFIVVLLYAGVMMVMRAVDEAKDDKPKEKTVQSESMVIETKIPDTEPVQETQEEDPLDQEVKEILDGMTTEEKVAQLFMITPESLTGVDGVTLAGDASKEAYDNYPVGGVIYFTQNLISPEQTKEMLSNMQAYSKERTGLPLLISVDEEGGTVTRIAGNSNFDVETIENMSEVGAGGDIDRAYEIGTILGGYLSELGFNMDFAPDADVLSNPDNQVVRERSFGSDPELVSAMVSQELRGLKENGVYGVLKHFPGHGATQGDTHEGYAYTDKSLEELTGNELIPFQRGIDSGASFVMVGHISVPTVLGDNTPSSLSSVMVTDVLRNQMGFNGVIITDALDMGAVAQAYTSQEAAVAALLAGVDMLLMPENFQEAYQGVLDAVSNGTITQERLDTSVARILKVKVSMQ